VKIIIVLLMMSLTGQVKAEDTSLHFAVSDREVRSLTAEQMEQQIQAQQIRLVKDPVFKKDKNFSCFPIVEVLRAGFGPIWQQALKDDDNGESIIVRMTTVDGHTGHLPISKITQPGGCLVYKDNDTNGRWERTGREMEPSAEPYYFVWTRPEQQKTRYLPRIPQVTLISLVPFKEALGPITPGRNASEQVRRGYELVTDKYDCLGCHRINGHGGKVALDLARPQNVTSYLPLDLIKKILYDARALRDGRMPTFNISDAEADDIISYLKAQTPPVESATLPNTSE
jgi:mono/diheme cytochrome c family protein